MGKSVTKRLPASFVRGGTSNGLLIHRKHLPANVSDWQPILASAMGSPDPYGRQLNGMGSGISSTSKICVIQKSKRADIDIDYTFVQVGIKDGSLDMAGNCGNMSSAVGPWSWEHGLVNPENFRTNEIALNKKTGPEDVTLRLFNTNTSKILHSTFRVAWKGNAWQYDPCGEYAIDGVSGTGSRVTLSFLDPAGAKTSKALPTGNPIDQLVLPGGESIEASLIDIANPGIFILASDAGVRGDVDPDTLGSDSKLMARLEAIRRAGAIKMGLDPNTQSIPKIVLLSQPTAADQAEGVNIVCRALSMQQAHRAVPLTLALNLGASCGLPGTLPARLVVNAGEKTGITIAHASGRLEVGRILDAQGNIESALLHRTARVMMEGEVHYTVKQ